MFPPEPSSCYSGVMGEGVGSTSTLYVGSLLTVFVALASLCLLTPHL